MRRHSTPFLTGLLAGLLAGCGGGDTTLPPPPRPKPAQTSDTPSIPVRAARSAPGRVAAPDEWSDRVGTPDSPIDPAADPTDAFVVVEGPNFELIAPGPNPADEFYVTAPEPGHDSSTFLVVDPATGPAPTRPDSDFEFQVGFEAVSAAGYADDGMPRRIRCERDEAEMVLVPAGTALVGTKDGPSEATPQIAVELDPFYVDVMEITVGQYGRYLVERRKEVTRTLQEPLNHTAPADRPALGLSWGAARDYALWAGKELPTEAQWEKAGRGPTGFEHPWGNGRAVFHRARTLSQIDPVGAFPLDRSPYGVLDLAGNAREWCLDFYSHRAFQDAAASGEAALANWEGPRRPSVESQRVVKGNGPGWKIWHRTGLSMREQRPDVGFRCVLRVRPPEPTEAERDRNME